MEAQRPAEKSSAPPYEQWPSVPRSKPGENANDKSSPMDLDRIMSSPEQNARTPTAFSMDDLEVAKALTGLREGSPAQSTTTLTSQTVSAQSPAGQPQQEPLLSLLTSQHPLVATAINNSLSAYTTSKTYSPRFRQGAEFVERNIASPVANTVGTAGRISGVETGVRWWLQRRNSGSESRKSNKRQRLDTDTMDVERGLAYRMRAPSDLSQPEFLPPYDSNRSPVYEEYAITPSKPGSNPEHAPALQNWQTRLMMSTSGLGVAMSDESLRSLKYCLSWLRWANNHLGHVLISLQSVLQEWERSQGRSHTPSAQDDAPISPSDTSAPPLRDNVPGRPPRDEAVITSHIAALKAECVKTLKNALEVVSTYAGGALPENARALVRRHLTSLPLRFRIANGEGVVGRTKPEHSDPEAQSGTPEVVSGAQRVVVLAKEGIDMMSQVSGVVDGTIVSAEEWCERLGRKKPAQNQGDEANTRPTEKNGTAEAVEGEDTKMVGAEKSG